MIEILALLASCSPPPPGFYATKPVSGASLPSNAQVALIGYAFGTPLVTVTTEDTAIDVTPLIENGVVLLDIEPLGLKDAITVFATATEPNSMSVTAQFVVTAEPDFTAPMFGEIQELTYQWFEDEPGLCQPGGFHVTARLAAATDDWLVSYYQLFEVTPNALSYVSTTYDIGDASVMLHAWAGYEETTHCYVAVATDVAGNRSQTTTPRCVDLAGTGADAGVLDSGGLDTGSIDTGSTDTGSIDSGPRDTGPRPDTGTGSLTLDDERGCNCSSTAPGTSGSTPSAMLLLIGLALVRRRR